MSEVIKSLGPEAFYFDETCHKIGKALGAHVFGYKRSQGRYKCHIEIGEDVFMLYVDKVTTEAVKYNLKKMKECRKIANETN